MGVKPLMGPRPYITCLDLATKTGVCHGLAGVAKPFLETWDLSTVKGRAQRLVLLDEMLERHFADHRPDIVFHEAPLPLGVMFDIGAREETIQMLRSLIATTEMACARNHIDLASWMVQTARRAVMGKGRFKRGEAKDHVMKFCKMLRHDPKNDNEADALIGWMYESALLNPRTAHVHTPLFSSVA